jgi:hypothetical protein
MCQVPSVRCQVSSSMCLVPGAYSRGYGGDGLQFPGMVANPRQVDEGSEMISTKTVCKLLPIFFALLLTVSLVYLFRSWSYDDPYITYRYAQNLIAGKGFVYNAGEKILSTTSPLLGLFLALVGFVWPNLPQAAEILGCIGLGASGYLIYSLCRSWDLPYAAWVGLFLLPIFPLATDTISSETPLYIAFGLAALLSYTKKKYLLTALFCSAIIFTRPDGILLPIVLALHYLVFIRGSIPWKAVMLFCVLNLIWWGGIWIYFGSPLPITLFAKQQQGVMTISQKFAPGFLTILDSYRQRWYFVVEAILALIGLAFLLQKHNVGLLLVAWTALYFVAYTVLGVTRYFWYYAPLVPGFIFLVGSGLQTIIDKARILTKPLPSKGFASLQAFLIIVLLIPHFIDLSKAPSRVDRRVKIYREVGVWLDKNTPTESSVGALEVGIIGYYSKRTIIDFAGLLQPEVAEQMRYNSSYQDTATWAVSHYKPDYVVLQTRGFPDLENMLMRQCTQEAYFKASQYDAPSDLIIFHCTKPASAWKKPI